MNKEQWVFKKHNNDTVEVVSTPEFQKKLKDQRNLQQTIEVLPLPTDPNVELVKKIHQQLPITNWAWKRKKQYDYKEEVNKENQHSTQQQQPITYPTHSKQPNDEFEL